MPGMKITGVRVLGIEYTVQFVQLADAVRETFSREALAFDPELADILIAATDSWTRW